jgi:G:T-mismatch repair DNA endonuclease (very short patch repair protein)
MGQAKPIEDWVAQYKSGMSLRDISKSSEFSHETIRHWLVRSGCKLSRRGRPGRKWTKQRKNRKKANNVGRRYCSGIEMDVDMMTPECLEYVGDRKYIVHLRDGRKKNPDFIYRKEKKIIELYGDYWHRNDDPQEVVADYNAAGYKCLVIWERELDDPESVLAKISEFLGITSWQMAMPVTSEECKYKKVKLVAYMRKEDADRLRRRAQELNMTISDYMAEILMWEAKYDLLPQLRKGGSITCNGKEKA